MTFVGLLGSFNVLMCVICFHISVENEKGRREKGEYDHEADVLDEELEELSRTDLFLLDEQVVLEVAFVAEDALVEDDTRCHTVRMNRVWLLRVSMFTVARNHPFRRYFHILQVVRLLQEILLHLGKQRSQCMLWKSLDLFFVAKEEERLFAST